MNTLEFLSYLRSLNIKLSVKGDRLKCHGPKGSITSSIKAELAQRKEEIVAFMRQTEQKSPITIDSVSRDRELPLSFAEERLWFIDQFIDQLGGKNPVYNIQRMFQLLGNLNTEALEEAIISLIKRHEILRTNFVTNKQGNPIVIIHPQVNFSLPIINLETLSEREQKLELDKIIQQENFQRLDLEKDFLISFQLIKLAPQEHRFIITIHHIIADGWSMNILTQELSQLYKDYQNHIPSSLSSLSIQYVDFAVWQREWLRGEILENQLNYWREQLKGIPPLLELPIDRPRPPLQTFRGYVAKFALNQELTEKLNAFSQKAGVTLFMTLFAAFSILLYRYTGQEDIVVGSGIANRHRKEIEGLIGFFVNMLALRINFQGNPSFAQLLTQIQKTALEAYAHQDLPFEKLVEELQPERGTSYSPLFQVSFFLQNMPLGTLELPDLTIKSLERENVTARFDLTVIAREMNDGIQLWWEYNSDLFDATTISRMAGHFEQILEGIVANPDQSISTLPLLTEAQRNQLLVQWNNTATDYPQDKCIHQLFQEQAAKTPDAVAVVFEEKKLTYQELNEKVNQLAHYLQKLGVKPETLVGICLERSLEMIIALLAIIKAGGAYVALDFNYPQERLALILEDAKISLLICQETTVNKLPLQSQTVINIDKAQYLMALENKGNPMTSVVPDNLVYIIYTSGTTGKPKGVMMNHNAVSNLIQWQINRVNFAHHRRTLQFAPMNFDISFQEIFSTFCSGGILVLICEQERKDFNRLVQFLEKQSIERLFLPFVALEQISQIIHHQSESLVSLQEIITAGEQLKLTPSIEKLRQKVKTLYNQYGPTEAHVVTEFTLQQGEKIASLPPIGSPIANIQVYVLDSQLQPVAIGVEGEIYIAGIGLARGYLNRPELTAEKFINNPFGKGRLYKTGDKGRYLPDGNLQFLGRIDHQVKIRGFRVELAEIETNLNQNPHISDALVVARENSQGDKYLAAYVIAKEEKKPKIKELRQFLGQKLPEYMIPSAFVFLDSLPLKNSGKIDHKALPEPNFEANRDQKFIAPRNPTEIKLAQIWQEVLDIEKVGINDNFFSLGGHSLLATQVISSIRKVFSVDLSLLYLFQFPTIAQLADHLDNLSLAQSIQVLSNNIDREGGKI